MSMKPLWMLGIFILLPSILFADAVSKNNSANGLYKKGKFNESLSRYSAAILQAPEEPILNYNIGNNLYKLGNFDKAIEEYDKAMKIPDKKTKAKLNYNKGNAEVKAGKMQEALDSYIEALRLDPNDKDAKFNLEWLRKMIRQNSKNQQGGNSKQNQKQQKKNQNGQDKKDQKNSEQQQQDQQDQQGQEGKKKEISKEDAERILNALQDDEKNTQKDVKRMRLRGDRNVEKDW